MSGILGKLEKKMEDRMGPVVVELQEIKKIMEKQTKILLKIQKSLEK